MYIYTEHIGKCTLNFGISDVNHWVICLHFVPFSREKIFLSKKVILQVGINSNYLISEVRQH